MDNGAQVHPCKAGTGGTDPTAETLQSMEPPYTMWSGIPRALLRGEFVLDDLKAHGKCTKRILKPFRHQQNDFTSREFCRGFPPYPSLPVRQEICNKHVTMYAELNCAIQVNADIVHNAKRGSWGQVIITCAQDGLFALCAKHYLNAFLLHNVQKGPRDKLWSLTQY